MKRWIKWTAGGLAAVVLLAAGAVAVGTQLYERRLDRRISLNVKPVAIPTDEASVERGKYLYNTRGCAECHGANGGGRVFVDDPKSGAKIAGPNITSSGAVARYQPVDWVRTIRHGVKPDGRPAMIMPSEDFNRLTDEDLGSLLAYVQRFAPQPDTRGAVQLPLPARVLYGFGVIQDASEKIDHSLPPAKPVVAAVSVEHGGYLANMCIGCHNHALSGGKIPGGPPDWPAAANITPGEGSAMARYPDPDKLLAMFQSGKRPDGTPIAVMPFESLRQLNDTDVKALHAYLKTVPPKRFGEK